MNKLYDGAKFIHVDALSLQLANLTDKLTVVAQNTDRDTLSAYCDGHNDVDINTAYYRFSAGYVVCIDCV